MFLIGVFPAMPAVMCAPSVIARIVILIPRPLSIFRKVTLPE